MLHAAERGRAEVVEPRPSPLAGGQPSLFTLPRYVYLSTVENVDHAAIMGSSPRSGMGLEQLALRVTVGAFVPCGFAARRSLRRPALSRRNATANAGGRRWRSAPAEIAPRSSDHAGKNHGGQNYRQSCANSNS
jgi:hypothetical protein